jgi:hypothetical protein
MDFEPRTTNHIIADLLQLAIDGEWSGQVNTACHCHPEYASCCPECGALEYEHRNFGAKRAHGEHEPSCKRMALIEEARAFLRVENDLAEERGEEGCYVP